MYKLDALVILYIFTGKSIYALIVFFLPHIKQSQYLWEQNRNVDIHSNFKMAILKYISEVPGLLGDYGFSHKH